MPMLCRQCGAIEPVDALPRSARCKSCGSSRMIAHAELAALSIAHIDCDAFYATVEKRDDPSLHDKPVIIGGGRRGVVSTACYIARRYGVRSAMPMFKALKACPDAVVIRPNMAKYADVGRKIRVILQTATPLVEPISIDEAFLDLTGSERLFQQPPAGVLAELVRRIEQELGVTASIGLSYNKFLAKLASDMDKPRGFAIIGRAEAAELVAALPVGALPGVGKRFVEKLERDGFRRVSDLARLQPGRLAERYGANGARIEAFAHAEDPRLVSPNRKTKSISSETTLETDMGDAETLRPLLWRQAEKVSANLKEKSFAAGSVVLKLKTDSFRTITRQRPANPPTQLAERLYQLAEPLLMAELDGRKFRLIGIGAGDLRPLDDSVDTDDLVSAASGAASTARLANLETAMAAIRSKGGDGAIYKGRAIGRDSSRPTSKSKSK